MKNPLPGEGKAKAAALADGNLLQDRKSQRPSTKNIMKVTIMGSSLCPKTFCKTSTITLNFINYQNPTKACKTSAYQRKKDSVPYWDGSAEQGNNVRSSRQLSSASTRNIFAAANKARGKKRRPPDSDVSV